MCVTKVLIRQKNSSYFTVFYQAWATCPDIVGYRGKQREHLDHDERLEDKQWKSGAIVDFGLDTAWFLMLEVAISALAQDTKYVAQCAVDVRKYIWKIYLSKETMKYMYYI